MREGVKSGKYQLGDLIIPKTFKKFCIDQSNGKIVEKEYTICGRKIPMDNIRKKLFEKHKKLQIIRETNDNIIRRCILTWADHSSVLNSGNLLITLRVCYSDKLFYTDEEMLTRTGKVIDVQELVESPEIYILGHTDDSLAEKLSYSETRVEDI